MPMFISRLTVLGASLVCSVDQQVSGEPAADGNFRGLEVADFADEDDVRVLTEEAAERGGEVEADVLRTCTWLTPKRLNSTGSSAVMMLVFGVLIREIDE